MALNLLEPEVSGGPTHEQKIDEIRRLFPRVKPWLDWWQATDVEAMLFPAKRKSSQAENDEHKMRNDTNPQESLHRVFYMIWFVLMLSIHICS